MEQLNARLPAVRQSLRRAIKESSARGLRHTALWQAEMLSGIATAITHTGTFQEEELVRVLGEEDEKKKESEEEEESDVVLLARAAFQVGEHRRCHALLVEDTSSVGVFLRSYALYLAIETQATLESVRVHEAEKSKPPSGGDRITATSGSKVLLGAMHELNSEIESSKPRDGDGFMWYVRGLVARRLGATRAHQATLFGRAVTLEPLLWCAWLELTSSLPSTQAATEMALPRRWTSFCALAHLKLELSHGASARVDYGALQVLFPGSPYVLSQLAAIAYQLKEYAAAMGLHEDVRRRDACRLTNLDDFSNILYVKGDRVGLATLASQAHSISPHSSTTLCIIGNHYSLGQLHVKSVLYFQRAVAVEPSYLPAWTLLGHEYVELRNIPAAMHAYGRALEINPRDYRPWYGLGQTYDLLQLGHYGLHYFWRTVNIRPFDSRMWIALGGCFEKQKRFADAVYCYTCAETTDTVRGDSRALTLLKIAELYDDRASPAHNSLQAIHYYEEYIASQQTTEVSSDPLVHALRVVGEHYALHGLSLCGTVLAHPNRAPSLEVEVDQAKVVGPEALVALRNAERYLGQAESKGLKGGGGGSSSSTSELLLRVQRVLQLTN